MTVLKIIAIVVTLDTKGEEAAYLKEKIVQLGYRPLIIDLSCGGDPKIPADIPASEVARAAGENISALRALDRNQRMRATEAMIQGAIVKLHELINARCVDGVVSIGGTSSAVMASTIMAEVPYRIPKLIMTSAACLPGSHRFFGPTGVTVMQCDVDLGGLNRLLKLNLAKAAGTICGMVEGMQLAERGEKNSKTVIAMTTNGWTEHAASAIFRGLEDRYEIVRFHATGLPEVAMERLIEEDYFAAVIDLVPSSITNEKFQGSRISWPRRLEVAGERGLPQIVAPSLVNVISRIRSDSPELLAEMKVRKYHLMDSLRILLWLNREELQAIATVYAQKLNKAKGPTKFLAPAKGWMTLEAPGNEFFDGAAMQAFIDGLRSMLKPEVELRVIDANLDSEQFGEAVAAAFREVVAMGGGRPKADAPSGE
jgi:uncharacterized protein (UPF0261 family)